MEANPRIPLRVKRDCYERKGGEMKKLLFVYLKCEKCQRSFSKDYDGLTCECDGTLKETPIYEEVRDPEYGGEG
ncbi:hypothetical protein LCGC14_2547490 [marine sediment metagenome]|uniref:Uncharacterized protein n=1 Tax=marine sediment metagenome TaxID=412755 RepID=A0A0F9ANW7_9ZZZZ